MTAYKDHPAWLYIIFPGVAMLLGWGLRGYIGGGPFGALIPGCFVALAICLLLGTKPEVAAIVALFGAVGVGYGGEMTYGQTLGFLRESDTVYWGLLGCLIKGGVWGLFGGAVLGVGLNASAYERKHLTIGFVLTILACYIGIKLINEPKLIYFSNRLDRPRGESWAGLLFAAITLLAYLRNRETAEKTAIPFRFARWGMLGGALGFSGGALWMVFGPDIPIEQKWIGWWKMMEFTFGLVFGSALGYCAYRNREALQKAGQEADGPGESLAPLIAFVLLIVAFFGTYESLDSILPDDFRESQSFFAMAFRQVLAIFLSFVFFGAVSIILGVRSRHAAWHVAITLTFFHTVLDYTRDLDTADSFGYGLSGSMQLFVLLLLTIVVGVLVHLLQRNRRPMHNLFLLALWSCYAIACVRSFGRKEYFFPPEGETGLSILFNSHPSIIFVHGTFTASAIITTFFILTRFSDAKQQPA